MIPHKGAILLAGVLTLLAPAAVPSRAAQMRFHYLPVDAWGNTSLQPAGPGGAAGEYATWFGLVRQPCNQQPRPNHLVTFRHPYTGRNVTVPLTLPEGTPRLEYRTDRVIYNYGSYTVEARFLPDGGVAVIYNSGLFRGL